MSSPTMHRMPASLGLFVILALGLTTSGIPITTQEAPIGVQTPSGRIGHDFRSSPVMFIENTGQWDDAARFQVWGGTAGTMWLAEDAIWITVLEAGETSRQVDKGFDARWPFEGREEPAPQRGVNIKLSFMGANPHPLMETFDRLDTAVSYFIGNEPDRWRAAVAVWGGVRYVDLYPDVDLEITNEGGQMVQRLDAQPGADLSAVRLRVEGADAATVEGDMLRLSTAAGEMGWPLFATDEASGAATAHPSGAQIFAVNAPFAFSNPDQVLAKVTPQSTTNGPADLLYGTFLGGTSDDRSNAVAVDSTNSVYVAGDTLSSDFPTTPGAFDRSYNSGYYVHHDDAFVAKLSPTGASLIYATFLGGTEDDWAYGIGVDATGNAYVGGSTYSSDFPITAGAFDRSFSGGYNTDAFVVKLNSTGSALSYATFLGGSTSDWCRDLALDEAGSAYVTGDTGSADFPTTPGAYDRYLNGGHDAYVVKFNATGSGLVYSTFLGGSAYEESHDVAVDGMGRAYVTGTTGSSDFPTTPGAFDRSNNSSDAYVVALNSTGSNLLYSTFLGGTGGDWGIAIALDGAGNVYITGETQSIDFPTTPDALSQSRHGYAADAFVAKLTASGSRLAYGTFLGGRDHDRGTAIVVDGTGNAYVSGQTPSDDFPTTPNAFDTIYGGDVFDSMDAFVVKLNPVGSSLAYATFLGGSSSEYGTAIALDRASDPVVTGVTGSADFPTTINGFDRSYNSWGDVFVTKL